MEERGRQGRRRRPRKGAGRRRRNEAYQRTLEEEHERGEGVPVAQRRVRETVWQNGGRQPQETVERSVAKEEEWGTIEGNKGRAQRSVAIERGFRGELGQGTKPTRGA